MLGSMLGFDVMALSVQTGPPRIDSIDTSYPCSVRPVTASCCVAPANTSAGPPTPNDCTPSNGQDGHRSHDITFADLLDGVNDMSPTFPAIKLD